MKNFIKKFNHFINEAVILPPEINDRSQLYSMEDAIAFGQKHDFDVVTYREFYESLSPADKKTAPPDFDRFKGQGQPFFALFHPTRNRAMFVICDPNIFRMMPVVEIMKDIIGHEKVHAEQHRRKGDIEYSMPSPEDRKAYFSNKDEIMAFAFTIANSIKKESNSFTDAVDRLRENRMKSTRKLWQDIKNYCDEPVINRYRKYIYLYLEKMFNED